MRIRRRHSASFYGGERDRIRNLSSPPRSAARFASCLQRSVDDPQQVGAFVGAVRRKSPPIAAIPQVCEKSGTIFMKMQEGSTSAIKYSGPSLEKFSSISEARQQIVQRLQRTHTSVFHGDFRAQSAASICAGPSL